MLTNARLVRHMQDAAGRFKESGARAQRSGEPRRGKDADRKELRRRFEALREEYGSPVEAQIALERIIGGNDLTDINYLARGAACARSVGLIEVRSGGTIRHYGTGFLVAPGVLMTNEHVVSDPRLTSESIVRFDYEHDLAGADRNVVEFRLLTDPAPVIEVGHDMCLVGVSPVSVSQSEHLSMYQWLHLSDIPGKTLENEYLTIIQHPGAQRKQVCVRENRLLRYSEDGLTLWYQTDTIGGSSGSPVFNQSWQVVALHHAGVPETNADGSYNLTDGRRWHPDRDPPVDESLMKWKCNEGIRISRILRLLKERYASHPLAKAVLEAVPPGWTESARNVPGACAQRRALSVENGKIELDLPMRISIPLPNLGSESASTSMSVLLPKSSSSGVPGAAGTPSATTSAEAEAVKVPIDTSDYAGRPGYNPNFFGTGKLRVPMPTYSKSSGATVTWKGKKLKQLDYWNYSVVLHPKRKLALVVAGHVDANLSKGNRTDTGWIKDERADALQIGREFYKKQSQFEAERDANPFDQGHLHMRDHAQWGKTMDEALKAGADTFHYSNCAPQFWRYNQGKVENGGTGAKLWLGLEQYVIDRFAANGKACIFTGPIFDAPKSTLKSGQSPKLNPDGNTSPDPTFGGFKIPKMFFKVVLTLRGQRLDRRCFIISQEDYLKNIDRLKKGTNLESTESLDMLFEKLSEAEAELYQVPINVIESLTGLKFPKIGGEEEEGFGGNQGGPTGLDDFDDIF